MMYNCMPLMIVIPQAVQVCLGDVQLYAFNDSDTAGCVGLFR